MDDDDFLRHKLLSVTSERNRLRDGPGAAGDGTADNTAALEAEIEEQQALLDEQAQMMDDKDAEIQTMRRENAVLLARLEASDPIRTRSAAALAEELTATKLALEVQETMANEFAGIINQVVEIVDAVANGTDIDFDGLQTILNIAFGAHGNVINPLSRKDDEPE